MLVGRLHDVIADSLRGGAAEVDLGAGGRGDHGVTVTGLALADNE
jgi:hypothetical protein